MNTQTRVRNYLVGLGRQRNNSTVTADDAHRLLDRLGIPQGSSRRSVISPTLNKHSTIFAPTGTTLSTRQSANGRRINTWQLQ